MRYLLGVWLWLVGTCHLAAYSLMGPYADWMTPGISYHQEGDIGGPVQLWEEYRWNVPILTFGFDPSFLDYFGQPGVDAVERAIHILDALPPASSINLANYSLDVRRVNYQAQAMGLLDLKSTTLHLLVQQLGLASPERFTWILGSRSVLTNASLIDTQYWIFLRNFDPETLRPSLFVNSARLLYWLRDWPRSSTADTVEYSVDPLAFFPTTVADGWLTPGQFFWGLTRDDVGGLRALLKTNNLNAESLIEGITGRNGNTGEWVNTAWRPGVDKITFRRMAWDAAVGRFRSVVIPFNDVYYTNDVPVQQELQRWVDQPDFIFSAGDLGMSESGFRRYKCTDTSRWINNYWIQLPFTTNGPGVIVPPVNITFNKLLLSVDANPSILRWGSFDGSTNAPIAFGLSETGRTSLTLAMTLGLQDNSPVIEWKLWVTPGVRYQVDSSEDLVRWRLHAAIIPAQAVFTLRLPASNQRIFYRITRQ